VDSHLCRRVTTLASLNSTRVADSAAAVVLCVGPLAGLCTADPCCVNHSFIVGAACFQSPLAEDVAGGLLVSWHDLTGVMSWRPRGQLFDRLITRGFSSDACLDIRRLQQATHDMTCYQWSTVATMRQLLDRVMTRRFTSDPCLDR